MKYTEFQKDIEKRLREAALSLWAPGNAETQRYLDKILENERMVGDVLSKFISVGTWEQNIWRV